MEHGIWQIHLHQVVLAQKEGTRKNRPTYWYSQAHGILWNDLLSLWVSCKTNKNNPPRSACFCSLLPWVRLNWKTRISLRLLHWLYSWRNKAYFRCYTIHWLKYRFGVRTKCLKIYWMTWRRKEGKMMTGDIYRQGAYFEVVLLIKRWGVKNFIAGQKFCG